MKKAIIGFLSSTFCLASIVSSVTLVATSCSSKPIVKINPWDSVDGTDSEKREDISKSLGHYEENIIWPAQTFDTAADIIAYQTIGSDVYADAMYYDIILSLIKEGEDFTFVNGTSNGVVLNELTTHESNIVEIASTGISVKTSGKEYVDLSMLSYIKDTESTSIVLKMQFDTGDDLVIPSYLYQTSSIKA